MEKNRKLNHFDDRGNAIMVDVSEKSETDRQAVAKGSISARQEVIKRIKQGQVTKGDVLGVARVAGIMAVKQTANLIPMCHPLLIDKCSVDFEIFEQENRIDVYCTVRIRGKTGVEMEALTGACVALLTIYDMCKAMDKEMVIEQVHLLQKTGGKSGDFTFRKK